MENATHFVEICKDELTGRYIKYPISEISKLRKNMDMTKKISSFHTVVVWQMKLKDSAITITGEEINGQTILIAESL